MDNGTTSFWGSLNDLTFGPQFRVESASADFTASGHGQITINVSNDIDGSMPLNGFHIEIDGEPSPNYHAENTFDLMTPYSYSGTTINVDIMGYELIQPQAVITIVDLPGVWILMGMRCLFLLVVLL